MLNIFTLNNTKILLVLVLSFSYSCNSKDACSDRVVDPQIDEAIETALPTINKVLPELETNETYKSLITPLSWQKLALEQPKFEGELCRHGALVAFDSQKNPTNGITLNRYDYFSKKYRIRKIINSEDITKNKLKLKKYFDKIVPNWDGKPITIPILSESFRMAISETALNENNQVSYLIKRGETLKADELMILKSTTSTKKYNLLASDAVFMSYNQINNRERIFIPPKDMRDFVEESLDITK